MRSIHVIKSVFSNYLHVATVAIVLLIAIFMHELTLSRIILAVPVLNYYL
jgi:hypothetical protein